MNSSNTIVRPGSRALQAAIAGDVFLPAAYDPDQAIISAHPVRPAKR